MTTVRVTQQLTGANTALRRAEPGSHRKVPMAAFADMPNARQAAAKRRPDERSVHWLSARGP
jgi:hypothetical protein